MAIFYVSPV